MMCDGSESVEAYRKTGEEFLHHFVELGGLKPTEKVLDVGSGIGRTAVPLTRYLGPEGGYCGIDVNTRGVQWCARHISRPFPNFRFELVDVYNGAYNRKGKTKPSEFRFPFEDASFDFANVSSVFTHMRTADMENYVREIARVLRPGGRVLATFFLLNEETLRAVEAGKATRDFRWPMEGFRTFDPKTPERGIAYPEDFVRTMLAHSNLEILEPIHFGSWSGRDAFESYQDIVIVEKPHARAP